MGMIRAEKLVFEYDKRDEEGNVIGFLDITVQESLPWRSI